MCVYLCTDGIGVYVYNNNNNVCILRVIIYLRLHFALIKKRTRYDLISSSLQRTKSDFIAELWLEQNQIEITIEQQIKEKLPRILITSITPPPTSSIYRCTNKTSACDILQYYHYHYYCYYMYN